MAAAETLYAAQFRGPEFLAIGRTNTITCPLRRANAAVAPDPGGTVTIRRVDGTAIVNAQPVTIVSSVPTYDVLSSVIASEVRRADYSVEWDLSVSGVPGLYRRSLVIGRSRLHPVIDDSDLVNGRHSDLVAQRPSALASYQTYVDEAWNEIIDWLRLKGTLTHLVLDAESLRLWHTYATLELIFNDFTLGVDGEKWETQRARYESKATAARDALTLTYDVDDDGVAETQRRPVTPVTFLAVSGSDPWGSW